MVAKRRVLGSWVRFLDLACIVAVIGDCFTSILLQLLVLEVLLAHLDHRPGLIRLPARCAAGMLLTANLHCRLRLVRLDLR